MSPRGFSLSLQCPLWPGCLSADRRTMADQGGIAGDGGRQSWMSQINLDMSPGQVVWPRAGMIVGLAICFAPVNVAAYLYTPSCCVEPPSACEPAAQRRRQRWDIDGPALQDRRDQFHTLRLGEYLDPFNPAVHSFLEQSQSIFFNRPEIQLLRSN